MKTAVYTSQPPDDMVSDIWKIYLDAMRPLARFAVQRHVMWWDECLEMMCDPAIQKWVTTDDDNNILGVGTITNQLSHMPLIAPEYFEYHWPDLYAADKIWYVGFVAAADGIPNRADVFLDLVVKMSEQINAAGGICGLDYCAYNETVRQMPIKTRVALRRAWDHNIRISKVDYQGYWIYDFQQDRPS